MKAEGVDKVIKETFSLTNRSCLSYHQLTLESSWAQDSIRKAQVADILLPKEQSKQGMRNPGNDDSILTALSAFGLTKRRSEESIP